MLHIKANRITLVLAYAFLEWVLIFLLLLNSLFSYLIIKFAHYFGLKQPCLLCSRLDHILEPQNPNSSYRQLICEHHAVELSTSAYCYTHHKLVESDHMCENCSFSHLHNHKHPSVVSVFRWLKEVGMVKSDGDCLVVENDDDDDGINPRCSCCGVTVNRYIVSPTQIANRDELLYPSDCDDEDDQNGLDIPMGVDSDLINEDDNSDGFSFWLPKGGCSMVDDDQEEYGELSKAQNSYVRERVLPHDVEFYIDLDDYQLVPVKMVGLEKEREDESRFDKDEDQKHHQVKNEKELNAENVSIHQTVANVGEKTEQVMELKRELVIKMELEETMMKEKLSNKGDEKEIKIDVQLSVSDVQVPEETETKNADLPTSENDETEVEDMAIKLGYELETMALDANEGHEEEKRVVDDAELIDEDKRFQTSEDQSHEVLNIAFDDQVTEETENQEKFNIASSSEFKEQWKTANGEIGTLETSDSEDKDEIVVPSIQFKEENPFTDVTTVQASTSSNTVCDEEEIKIDAQLSVCHVQVPEETIVPNSVFPRSENDDTKVEDMALEQVDELGVMESDSTKVKELLGEGHEEDKRVLDDAEFLDTTKKYLFDDQVTEEMELNQVQSSDLCSRENGETETLNSLELTDKSQMVEPSIPCKEECQFTNVITFEASTSSSTILLENGDCELKQTKETQEHNYVEVETILLFDSAVDKSIVNELERIVEELKCDLKSEQNTLCELYKELEEERNAAAVAANQTMLMISRLQEEKASIEMKALQYQRMMEEQSEYDQEALQLMNEILVKREKELETYQKKISEFEKRDIRLRNRSCTEDNEDESDEESTCRCDQNGHQLDSFEEERLLILERLKVLEQKLCTLSEEESIDQFEHFNGDSNGIEQLEKGGMSGQKPKQLLPLFDAAEMESDDGLDSFLMIPKSSPRESEMGSKRFEIEQEVNHMYDRLHALEADKEFIKHCIGSLRKGDRGVLLLQEILQHLRDLKSIELQSRNLYGSC